MANFMDGFMKGYSFMEGVEDNKREREWQDTVRTRTKSTWAKEDYITDLTELGNEYKLLTHDAKGNPLSAEEYTKKPEYNNFMAKASRVKGVADKFKNTKGHNRQFKNFVPQEGGGVAVSMSTYDPKSGAMMADNVPLTNEGGSGDNEQVTMFDSPAQFDSFFQSQMTKIPGWADSVMASRKEAGQVSTLASVLPDQQQPTRQGPAPGQSQSTDPRQNAVKAVQATIEKEMKGDGVTYTPDQLREKVTNDPRMVEALGGATSGKQPVNDPSINNLKDPKESASSTSILDRQKQLSKKPVSADTRKSGFKLLKEAWKKNRTEGVANYFDVMTNPDNTSQLAKNAVREIQADPLDAGEKFLKSREAIEAKLGPERTEQLRKDLLQLTTPKAGKADLTDQNKYQRIAKVRNELETAGSIPGLSPKAVIEVNKAKSTIPKEPAAKQKQVEADQKLVADTKVGVSFSKQSGANSKARKESIARLIIAGVISAEQGSRISRTGRMTKKDVQVVSNKNMVGVYDKETEQFKTIATFGSGTTKADKQKSIKGDLDIQTKRNAINTTIANDVYGKKDHPGKADLIAKLATTANTIGLDEANPNYRGTALKAAKMHRNFVAANTGWIDNFAGMGDNRDFPSLTPFYIAAEFSKEPADVLTQVIDPINKALPGAADSTQYLIGQRAVAVQKQNPSMTLKQATEMVIQNAKAQAAQR